MVNFTDVVSIYICNDAGVCDTAYALVTLAIQDVK